MAGPAFGTNVGQDFTFTTIVDQTNNQFKFVVLGTDGHITLSTAGKRAIGVMQDAPIGTAAQQVGSQVRTAGPSKVVCGGTFVAGDLLSSDASGKAVKYTAATVFTGTPYTVSGTQVLGVALEPGAASAVVAMLFQPSGLAG